MSHLSLDHLLTRGVAEIISEKSLRARLNAGKPLRLKMGFDPSKPDLHIGHAVGIRKLRQFQDLGHQVVLIVGDWTAQIGDPSGRDEARTMLTAAQVKANADTYMKQFFQIVDRAKTQVRWQSEWFGKFTLESVFHLAKQFTLADMLEHETFSRRVKEGLPLTLIELIYPALQAYDSIAIDADVEFGGMDQKFNILAGRQLQSRLGKTPQEVFLVPLLIGTDGRKMGKSLNNTIDFITPPNDLFGKVMSVSDDVIVDYFTLVTDAPDAEIAELKRAMKAGKANPRDLKARLAREIIAQFHGADAARAADEEFVRVFSKKELPSDMPTFAMTRALPIIDLLMQTKLADSRSDARRLIQQGGVKIDDRTVKKIEEEIPAQEAVLRVGRRKFVRLVVKD
ncbi:MAG: tyrosine--tRNA ligase [Chloroflexi bacterium]|nr:tyrosine--tRNA ligase [Chloroflexota bacterium]MBI3740306.1 tyrosine--tRNA ligase [Chloroflexota bacterium]